MRNTRSINSTITLLAAALSMLVPFTISAAEGPCDIYQTTGTPCVAAYSTVRSLSSKYTGPLYQVRRTSDQQTKDITQTSDGYANSADQETFLGTSAGTISKLYDQSGKANDLTVAKKGSYTGTAAQNDKESDAKAKSFMANGHKVYALYTKEAEGYRAKQEGYSGYPAKVAASAGVPTGNQPQGIYMLVDGSRANTGPACCFDFGNASLNNAAGGTGMMNTLFFGVCTYWATGADNGPWFLNDMEAGVWGGGSGASKVKNNNNPSAKFDFAFGLTKTSTEGGKGQYAIRVANKTIKDAATALVTAYDGQSPSTWKQEGGIVLGIGGDNSNSSNGTFYEGCMTAGRPSDATDALILKNIQNAGYGSTVVSVVGPEKITATTSIFSVRCNPSFSSARISYTLPDSRRVSITIFDQQGKRIATIANGVFPAGMHEAVWDAKRAPAGAYIYRTSIDGVKDFTGKIILGKKSSL